MRTSIEYNIGPAVIIATPTIDIVTVSPSDLAPDLVVKDIIIRYSAPLVDSGAVIIDEPLPTYTLIS